MGRLRFAWPEEFQVLDPRVEANLIGGQLGHGAVEGGFEVVGVGFRPQVDDQFATGHCSEVFPK